MGTKSSSDHIVQPYSCTCAQSYRPHQNPKQISSLSISILALAQLTPPSWEPFTLHELGADVPKYVSDGRHVAVVTGAHGPTVRGKVNDWMGELKEGYSFI